MLTILTHSLRYQRQETNGQSIYDRVYREHISVPVDLRHPFRRNLSGLAQGVAGWLTSRGAALGFFLFKNVEDLSASGGIIAAVLVASIGESPPSWSRFWRLGSSTLCRKQ